MEKINFLAEVTKCSAEEPLDRGAVLKSLTAIPEDVAQEYCNTIGLWADEVLLLKKIASSIGKTNTLEHLFEGLNEEQLGKISRLATLLTVKELESHVREITEISFNVCLPTADSVEKGTELLSVLRSYDIDYKEQAMQLAALSRCIKHIADILVVMADGKHFDEHLIERLSQNTVGQIDVLSQVSKALIPRNAIKAGS